MAVPSPPFSFCPPPRCIVQSGGGARSTVPSGLNMGYGWFSDRAQLIDEAVDGLFRCGGRWSKHSNPCSHGQPPARVPNVRACCHDTTRRSKAAEDRVPTGVNGEHEARAANRSKTRTIRSPKRAPDSQPRILSVCSRRISQRLTNSAENPPSQSLTGLPFVTSSFLSRCS